MCCPRLNGVNFFVKRKVPTDEMAAWRERWLAVGSDAGLLAELEAGRMPDDWAPLGTTTEKGATFLSPLDPISARGRAEPPFGFDYTWEVHKPASQRRFGDYTMPILRLAVSKPCR